MNEFSMEIASELFTSTEQFPVDFNNAWQWLKYDRKDSAKRYLIDNLEEEVDFRIIVDSTQPQFGKPRQDILLSIEGFKNWAMMSKTATGKQVRKYFLECERIAKESVNTKPLTTAQLLLAQAQVLVDLEESVLKVAKEQLEQNYRLEAIEQRSLNAIDSLKLLPAATVEVEQMTPKANLNRLVRGFVVANSLDYRTTWNSLYREMRDRTHIDLKVRGKNHKPQLSGVEYAEKFGYIEQLYAVAYEMFASKQA